MTVIKSRVPITDGAAPQSAWRGWGWSSGLADVLVRSRATVHGVLCWRTRAQLVALALHVVQDHFPGLRERGVKRIDLATGDAANASLTSSTVDMPATFPGTEILNRQLRARGIASLQLSVGLTPRQIVSSVLLLLCVSRRRSGDGAPAGDTTYLDQKIRVALTSSAGHCQFGARMHWDAASGRYRGGTIPAGRQPRWRGAGRPAWPGTLEPFIFSIGSRICRRGACGGDGGLRAAWYRDPTLRAVPCHVGWLHAHTPHCPGFIPLRAAAAWPAPPILLGPRPHTQPRSRSTEPRATADERAQGHVAPSGFP